MTWALPEWTVLAAVREQPRHGFAIAALTAPDGDLGKVWQIPRPVVYRALGRLEEARQVEPTAVESGSGPQRTVYGVTAGGRAAVDDWLARPVPHVRDIRSQLLMKLVLLHRRRIDAADLLAAQRAVITPIVAAIDGERRGRDGVDSLLLAWRHTGAMAALAFLTEIEPSDG